jgi:hypothetical protein
MASIEKCPIPAESLLENYVRDGGYTDRYRTRIPQHVSFPEFIFAFYTTPLFKLERFILKWLVSKPSTDAQARKLADGLVDEFAAWRVEDRRENEILMCDYVGRTRSGLMSAPSGSSTDFYFGSAVVPVHDPRTGKLSLGFAYEALLEFHKIYSILLLYSGRVRIQHRLSK